LDYYFLKAKKAHAKFILLKQFIAALSALIGIIIKLNTHGSKS